MLIDADNISAKAAPAILAETARHGTVSIKRAYGDFTSPRLAAWKLAMAPQAIQPILQLPNTVGKNATDSALIIDAMDLLYTTDTDVFCIVSSDSDFTRLATRLREEGKYVVGIGASTTAKSFINACDKFTFIEVLTQPVEEEPSSSASDPGAPPPIDGLLRQAVDATAKDDGWSLLSTLGSYLVNTHAAFDSRLYGYAKLGDLVRSREAFEVAPISQDSNQLKVRRVPKPKAKKAPRKVTKKAASKKASASAARKTTPGSAPAKRG